MLEALLMGLSGGVVLGWLFIFTMEYSTQEPFWGAAATATKIVLTGVGILAVTLGVMLGVELLLQ
jgi:hypothetical protein